MSGTGGARFGVAVAALLIVGPLELRDAWPVGPLRMTSTELVAALACAIGLFETARARSAGAGARASFGAAAWAPAAIAAWVALHLLSAAWADPPVGAVVKAGLRVAGHGTIALLCWRWADDPAFLARFRAGLMASLVVIAALGVGERAFGREFEHVLLQFRDEPTWMLGEQRLATVFYHANTCAGFFELTAPLWIVAAARADGGRRAAILAGAALVAVLLSLTYSRAGLIAACAGSATLAWAARRGRAPPATGRLAIGWAALVVGAYAVNPDMRARIGLDERSYRPEYAFAAGCAGHPGDRLQIPASVRNRGTWPLSNRQAPAAVMHTWLTEFGRRASPGWSYAALPDLPAGSTAVVALDLELPARPGEYVLAVDIFRDRVLRVSAVGAPLGWLGCTVVPAGTPIPLGAVRTRPPLSTDAVREGRAMDLERRHYWRAAVLLWERKPWLGWGSDRFPSIHREYVPAQGFDARARAHSIVLQTAVDLGLIGVAMVLALVGVGWRAARRAARSGWAWDGGLRLALAAGLAGFLVHGLVDYFWAYTQIAVIAWPMVGVLMRPPRPDSA